MTNAPDATHAGMDDWKRCNICKRSIAFGARHYVCSVSTCNRKRTGMVFCSVECCDAHAPVMNHREYWAEERRAPTREAWEAQQAAEATASADADSAARARRTGPMTTPRRREEEKTMEQDESTGGEAPQESVIVASKLKKYIRARSGMNTSDAVVQVLSDRVRELCDQAIRRAGKDGRKTVMDRDVPPLAQE